MTDGTPTSPDLTPQRHKLDPAARLVWGMLGLTILCIGVIAATPGLFFGDTGYFHDLFVTFDIVYRTGAGVHSSLDYFNPIGPVLEWIYRLVLLAAPLGVRVINLGNALIAGLSIGLSWITLRRRADPMVMALVALTSASAALTGLDPDRPLPLFQVSHLAPYNYWGWALLCPVALRMVLPPRPESGSAQSDWPGALACALALAAMFMLKANYAVGGVGLIVAALLLRTITIREGAVVLFGMAFAIAVADLLSHGQVRAYILDLREVSHMPESGIRVGRLIGGVLTGLLPMAAFSLALFIGLMRDGGAIAPRLRQHRRALLAIGALGVAAVIVSMQDHDNQGVVLLPLMPVAVIEWARASMPNRQGWHGLWSYRPEWLVAALLIILPLPAECLVATIREAAMLLSQKSEPRLDGTPYNGLTTVFAPVRIPAERSVAETQYWTMIDGWQLLKTNGVGRDATIAALAFSNPFPAVMNARALSHVPSWLHDGRSFSSDHHIAPALFFAGVSHVMEARNDENATALTALYGPYLHAHYRPLATSDEWVLWVRQ